jgi:hypothetical protein
MEFFSKFFRTTEAPDAPSSTERVKLMTPEEVAIQVKIRNEEAAKRAAEEAARRRAAEAVQQQKDKQYCESIAEELNRYLVSNMAAPGGHVMLYDRFPRCVLFLRESGFKIYTMADIDYDDEYD